MKFKRVVALLCCLCFMLSGCGSLLTVPAVIQYAESNFGACKLLSKEKIDNGISYIFEDKEYGFHYVVESYMSDISIDNSSFGSVATESSDFNKEYYTYLVSIIAPELSYDMAHVSVEFKDTSIFTGTPKTLNGLAIVNASEEEGKVVAEQVGQLFQKYDTRGYYKECDIPVYSGQERLGSWSLALSSWQSIEDETIAYFTEIANRYDKDAEYLRSEQKLFSEIGLSLDDVAARLDNPVDANTLVTFYYFHTDSGERFVADVLVKPSAEYYTDFTD